jgi:hypothetical protein
MKRRVWSFENDSLRILVTQGGGHIAGLHLKKGYPKAKRLPNPLWAPPWKSIEPWQYQPKKHDRAYGGPPEGRLLAGIAGHNLALDTYGTPSEAEVRAGAVTHGEAGVARWSRFNATTVGAKLPVAQLRVSRQFQMHPDLPIAIVTTTVENLWPLDRPIAWAEHVTFGPPFLAAYTEFNLPARRAMVYPADFGADSILDPGREFVWPMAPLRSNHNLTVDWQRPPAARRATDFTTQLFETPGDLAWFTAVNRRMNLAVGYLFRRSDFPWLCIWDEKYARAGAPWNRRTWARAMEFSTTPFAMSRRGAIDMGKLFGTPTYRWVEAKSSVTTRFVLFLGPATQQDLMDQALRFMNS